MHRIIQANIARFKELLKAETDPVKRAMESRLLAEEEAKLKEASMPDEKESLLDFSDYRPIRASALEQHQCVSAIEDRPNLSCLCEPGISARGPRCGL